MDSSYAVCIGNIMLAHTFCEMGLMFGFKGIFSNNDDVI